MPASFFSYVFSFFAGSQIKLLKTQHLLSSHLSAVKGTRSGIKNLFFVLMTHSTHFIYGYMERETEMFYLTMH